MNTMTNHTRVSDIAAERRSARMRRFKRAALLLSLALLAGVVISGSLAYLKAQSGAVTNEFKPGKVDDEITEEFDKTVKKNVNVKNTGEVPAYIRVKLVTYRVNEAGEHIGGTAAIPDFTPGTNWVKHTDGFYYYTKPVAPDKSPDTPLIGSDGITLQTYTDEFGGHQVIEVLGEAIQATPPDAVHEAWKVTIAEGSVTAYTEGGDE